MSHVQIATMPAFWCPFFGEERAAHPLTIGSGTFRRAGAPALNGWRMSVEKTVTVKAVSTKSAHASAKDRAHAVVLVSEG